MSTTLVAALLAGLGVVAVLAVSYVFYLVGRAEDRERESAAPAAPPAPEPVDEPARRGELARERRRPLPPRRPQR